MRVARVVKAATDAEDDETAAAQATQEAERRARVAEAQVRRLQSELLAVRGALRTALRVLAPYYLDE